MARWRDAPGAPLELVDAVTAALAARRPRLAARLVGLIDADLELDPPQEAALQRARTAARFLLVHPSNSGEAELHAAWDDLSARLGARARARMRSRHRDEPPPRGRKRRR